MKNFNEIYEKIYKENQEPLEKMRKEAKNAILCVIIPLIIIAIVLVFMTASIFPIFIGIIITILYMAIKKTEKNYTSIFKQTVVKTFVKEYSEKLEYKPTRGISSYTYIQGEFERFDIYHSEDLITGLLEDGNTINMAEVHTENRSTDSDGNTTYTTLFHGLFAEISINKIVETNLKIRRNGITLFNKEKIEMDSAEFEKKYNVFATDKIIAMQLLTSDIMQMLLDFKQKSRILPEITLKQNYLYIRFYTGDVFETNIMKASLDYDTLKRYYDIINFTLKLTEAFVKNIKETDI